MMPVDYLIKDIRAWTFEDCAYDLVSYLNSFLTITQCDPEDAHEMKMGETWCLEEDRAKYGKESEIFAIDIQGNAVYFEGGQFKVKDLKDD